MTDETTHIARQDAALGDELMPCPFCGSAADLDYRHNENDGGGGRGVVACTECGAETVGEDHGWMTNEADKNASKAEAVAAWNRRSDLTRPSLAGDERVARLVEAARPFVTAMDLAKAALRQHPDVGHLETLAALYTGWTDRKELRAALSAMNTPAQGGEE